MKILIIDDEPRRMQPLVDYMVIVCGWAVRMANGPREAMTILGGKTDPEFDVVILDIMMDPEGIVDRTKSEGGRRTGLLLLSKVRLALPRTLIVVYTAKIDVGELASDPRVAAVVQKPSSAGHLVSRIRSLLNERG